MSRLTIYILLFFAFTSCENNDFNDNKKGNNQDSKVTEPTGFVSPRYKDNFGELYTRGLEAVKTNNVADYNAVLKHYGVSPFHYQGVSITMLMATRNNHAEAYYDACYFIRGYSDSATNNENGFETYVHLLKQAKKYGYEFEDFVVGSRTIRYDEL